MKELWLKSAMNTIRKMVPDRDVVRRWRDWSWLLPQALAVIKHSQEMNRFLEERIELMDDVGNYYQRSADFRGSMKLSMARTIQK
ncbi:hypothetical protein H1S01_17030 [Heliobacterium chlorum]|uniref:Uncharacterized protein n=1 Tax=Heliobacterium chlorum TaxID=2698 RepID=A0ABR7T927_HELCL|nr:hypothetical protein [Heliobacterium chlorum]MBC9786171.1 hypothetical protein [Heliobacterium chlorum]